MTHQQKTAFENIVGKGEIARNEQFLLCPQCFQLNQITVSPFVHIFDIIPLFHVESEEPKIGLSGKGLITRLRLTPETFFFHSLQSAGDHVKFNLPMAYSTWVLEWGFLKFKDAYAASGQTDMMCDMIKWPLDYFLKCWVPDQNTLYVQVCLQNDYIVEPCSVKREINTSSKNID